MSLLQRLKSLGPKRMLALDGGGIRGALTAGYLVEMEALLRQRHDDPQLVLARAVSISSAAPAPARSSPRRCASA